jgi:hypothetical protein
MNFASIKKKQRHSVYDYFIKAIIVKRMLAVRIYFGIYHFSIINWPNRCLCCGGDIDKWLKITSKTFRDFRLRITWAFIIPLLTLSIPSRRIKISYPVCKDHHSPGHDGLQIHWVNKDYVAISIPDGQYASDFSLLNNCNIFNGHLLIQDVDLDEIVITDSIVGSQFGDDRIMCPDESCIGIIENSKCTECGRKL